jgi:hypothetical protein
MHKAKYVGKRHKKVNYILMKDNVGEICFHLLFHSLNEENKVLSYLLNISFPCQRILLCSFYKIHIYTPLFHGIINNKNNSVTQTKENDKKI